MACSRPACSVIGGAERERERARERECVVRRGAHQMQSNPHVPSVTRSANCLHRTQPSQACCETPHNCPDGCPEQLSALCIVQAFAVQQSVAALSCCEQLPSQLSCRSCNEAASPQQVPSKCLYPACEGGGPRGCPDGELNGLHARRAVVTPWLPCVVMWACQGLLSSTDTA